MNSCSVTKIPGALGLNIALYRHLNHATDFSVQLTENFFMLKTHSNTILASSDMGWVMLSSSEMLGTRRVSNFGVFQNVGYLPKHHQLNFCNLKIQNRKHLEYHSRAQSIHMCSILDLGEAWTEIVGTSSRCQRRYVSPLWSTRRRGRQVKSLVADLPGIHS